MKQVKFIYLFLLLLSCDYSKNHTMSVKNESNLTIDSVIVLSSVGQVKIGEVAIGKSTSQTFSVNDKINSEGAFSARLYLKDTVLFLPSFGYYSNAATIPKVLSLTVDTNLQVRE